MLVARGEVVTYVCLSCVVSSLSVVSPLAKFVRNKRRMKKYDGESRKVLMNRFYLQHGIFGLLLVLQDSL